MVRDIIIIVIHSASTLKSWSDDGWKSTSAESSNTSRNPSEAEAMGPDQDDDEDLNVAVNEGDNDPPALANISLISGLELLAVTNESQDNSTLDEQTSQRGSCGAASSVGSNGINHRPWWCRRGWGGVGSGLLAE